MKNVDWSFPRWILATLVILLGGAAYPLTRYGDTDMIRAVLAGTILTTLNVLLGFAAIEYSYERSMTTFFKYVLGGMGVRMMLMGGILVLLIKVFQFPAAPLVASMGILYIIFLTLEVYYIQKKVHSKQQ